jgi:rod shape-determining protein MreB
MDQAISDYIRHERHVVVGEQAAEMIKITLGAALPMSHNRSMTVAGKSLNNGSPQEVTITSDEVFHVIDGIVRMITEGVHRVLEQASPETAADLCKTGLTLTGGGSLLRDLDIRFRSEFELPVYRADNPLESVALGLGYLLEDERLLDQFKIDENAAEWTNDAEMIYSAAR